MTALNPAEAGIPEEVCAGWRNESGHKSEENFETALGKLGVETVQGDPDSRKSDKLVSEGKIAARRSSAKEDFEKGIDFHIFNPLTGRMVPVDISVSKDPAVHAHNPHPQLKEGIRFLPLSARNLELASRGSERDLQEVWRNVNTLLLSDALDLARRGKVQIPQERLTGIERKLAELH